FAFWSPVMAKRRPSRWSYPQILQRQLELEPLEKRESPTDVLHAAATALPAAWLERGWLPDPVEAGASDWGRDRYRDVHADSFDLPRLPNIDPNNPSGEEGNGDSHGGHRFQAQDVSAVKEDDSDMPHQLRPWDVIAQPFSEQGQGQEHGAQDGGG